MKIKNAEELTNAIAMLEAQKEIQKEALSGQFKTTLNSLNPLNKFSNAIGALGGSEIIKNLLLALLGAGTGALSKKILIDKSTNFLKRMVRKILQFAVEDITAKKV